MLISILLLLRLCRRHRQRYRLLLPFIVFFIYSFHLVLLSELLLSLLSELIALSLSLCLTLSHTQTSPSRCCCCFCCFIAVGFRSVVAVIVVIAVIAVVVVGVSLFLRSFDRFFTFIVVYIPVHKAEWRCCHISPRQTSEISALIRTPSTYALNSYGVLLDQRKKTVGNNEG